MGRAPCCDKANVKKGPWSPEEDTKLKAYIEQHGTGGNWIALPQKIGLKRCGKSCRLRWLNYLRPNIKHGGFSEEEDNIICSLYISIGSRWSIIAAQLPGRTDNDIKNYWNTRLKKKLLGKQRKDHQSRRAACAIKQETKKETGGLMLAGNSVETPYWPPQQPLPISIPYPAQGPRTNNDQASLRKLLIKLGGRFSDADDETHNTSVLNSYAPIDAASTENFYGSTSAKLISSSAPMNSFSGSCSWLPDNQLINSSNNMMQTPNDISNELEEIIYSNHPHRMESLDCFYGPGVASESCGTSCESISWGDMSSLLHPSVVSTNYEQGMFQECLSTETRYLGLQ